MSILAITLSLLALLLLSGLGAMLWRLRAQLRDQTAALRRLADDLDLLADAQTGLSETLLQLQREYGELGQRQGRLESLSQGGKPYTLAIDRIRAGATVEDLERDCGLSRGEAELLLALNPRPDDSGSDDQPPPGWRSSSQ